jgi:predicted dehydrogenase
MPTHPVTGTGRRDGPAGMSAPSQGPGASEGAAAAGALRLAVVGCGWAGSRQVEALRELNERRPDGPRLALACLVDNDPDFLAARAQELGVAKTYSEYARALADPDVDAVSICSPHRFHHHQAIQAARAGKHVLVEKPMALTVDEATEMIAAAESHGVTLYVAESRSYESMTAVLRALVREHAIGDVTSASVTFGFRSELRYPGRRAWLTDPRQGGTGTWMLHGIHSMAQLRQVLGEVETVYMQEHHAAGYGRPELEGTMSGLLTLQSGVNVAVVQTAETLLPGDLEGYVIRGDRGTIRAWSDGYQVFAEEASANASEGGAVRRLSAPSVRRYPETLSPHALELAAFADHIGGAGGPTDGRSERRSLAIVQAGYESAASGLPVNLRHRFGEL